MGMGRVYSSNDVGTQTLTRMIIQCSNLFLSIASKMHRLVSALEFSRAVNTLPDEFGLAASIYCLLCPMHK